VGGVALEDVAKLISPKRPDQVLRLLGVFRGGSELTKEELVRQSGLSESMVEYYVTKLREWYMLGTRRNRRNQVVYSLNPDAFHARVDTLLVDPIRNLVR